MKTLKTSLRKLQSITYEDYGLPEPGHAPDYIKHLQKVIRKAAKNGVVLYARISDPRPGKRETTSDQLGAGEAAIKLLEKEFSVSIPINARRFSESVSGWRLTKAERPELVKAAKLAAKLHAPLVAFDVSRFVRNEGCQGGALPTVDDFDRLMRLVGKAELATIADPKIHEDRSRSVRRGHKAKNAKPGRPKKPKKKTYRKSFDMMPNKLARVVRLRDQGKSWSEIAKAVDRAESTIRGWYSHE